MYERIWLIEAFDVANFKMYLVDIAFKTKAEAIKYIKLNNKPGNVLLSTKGVALGTMKVSDKEIKKYEKDLV